MKVSFPAAESRIPFLDDELTGRGFEFEKSDVDNYGCVIYTLEFSDPLMPIFITAIMHAGIEIGKDIYKPKTKLW